MRCHHLPCRHSNRRCRPMPSHHCDTWCNLCPRHHGDKPRHRLPCRYAKGAIIFCLTVTAICIIVTREPGGPVAVIVLLFSKRWRQAIQSPGSLLATLAAVSLLVVLLPSSCCWLANNGCEQCNNSCRLLCHLTHEIGE
jgi:hypothetical protein